MSRFVKVHGATVLWAVLIFALSSVTSLEPMDIGFRFQDKLAHFLEFGVFGFLLQRSFNQFYGNRFKGYLLVFIGATFYGVLDEIHQSFVPGREADVSDFLADTIGIIVAQVIFWMSDRKNFFRKNAFFC